MHVVRHYKEIEKLRESKGGQGGQGGRVDEMHVLCH